MVKCSSPIGPAGSGSCPFLARRPRVRRAGVSNSAGSSFRMSGGASCAGVSTLSSLRAARVLAAVTKAALGVQLGALPFPVRALVAGHGAVAALLQANELAPTYGADLRDTLP